MPKLVVTHAETPRGLALVRSLLKRYPNVFAASHDADCEAFHLLPAVRRIHTPKPGSPTYARVVRHTASVRRIQFIVPAGEEGLASLVGDRWLFELAGARVLAPTVRTVEACRGRNSLFRSRDDAERTPGGSTSMYFHKTSDGTLETISDGGLIGDQFDAAFAAACEAMEQVDLVGAAAIDIRFGPQGATVSAVRPWFDGMLDADGRAVDLALSDAMSRRLVASRVAPKLVLSRQMGGMPLAAEA